MAIDVKKKYPRSLRTQQFWNDFGDALSTELQNFRTNLPDFKVQTFDRDQLLISDNQAQLVEICKMLGFTPDFSLINTTQQAYDEVAAAQLRVKYKTTYIGYAIIFDMLKILNGQVFNYYWNGTRLVRAYSSNIFTNVAAQKYEQSFLFQADQNYESFEVSLVTLDQSNPSLNLDYTPTWYLDQSGFKVVTKHLGGEFFIYQLIQNPFAGNTNYCMTKEYLDYLLNGMNYNRKVTEVVHAGCQISAVCDNSGYFDNAFSAPNPYSINAIQLICSVIPANYSSITTDTQFGYMKIGTGTQALKSKSGAGSYPTDLASASYQVVLDSDSYDETSDWFMGYADFKGNQVNVENIGTGNGSTISFAYSFLRTPILPGSIKITYVSGYVTYNINDQNKDGTLNAINATGTINYTTGALTLTTQNDVQIIDEQIASTRVTSIDHFMAFEPIVPSTFVLHYIIGSVQYIVVDNGNGTIGNGTGSDGIIGPAVGNLGTINYATGEVIVDFSGVGTDISQPIYANYEYTATTAPDSGNTITLQYQTLNPMLYTEAGLFDTNKNIVAYATFPPIELRNVQHYTGIQFFLKRSAFPNDADVALVQKKGVIAVSASVI